MEKCCEGVLWRSVVKECCREVLFTGKDFAKECCEGAL